MSTMAGFFGALWIVAAWLFAKTARVAGECR
jgi:hypothetical protein